MNDTIGIDVGKDTLVVHRLSDKSNLEVTNDKAGLTVLLRWLGKTEAPRVIFEPTGPYHRLLEKTLAASGIAMIKVNGPPRAPASVLRHRKAEGEGEGEGEGEKGCEPNP